MAHRGRDTAALRTDEAGRTRRPGTGRERLRGSSSFVRTRSRPIISASSASRRRSSGPSRRGCSGWFPDSSRRSSSASAWCIAIPTSMGRGSWPRPGRCGSRSSLFFAGQMSGVEGYDRVGGVGADRRDECGGAGARRAGVGAAADDRDRGARLLRVARESGSLRSVRTSRSGSSSPLAGAPRGKNTATSRDRRTRARQISTSGSRPGA